MDSFDATLDSLADILVRDTGQADAYGHANPQFTVVASGVPCRVSLGKGRAKEFKADKKTGLNYREVFLRPWPDGDGTVTQLTHDHWLRIDGVYYDIFQIDDPGNQHHHLEVWCTLLLT